MQHAADLVGKPALRVARLALHEEKHRRLLARLLEHLGDVVLDGRVGVGDVLRLLTEVGVRLEQGRGRGDPAAEGRRGQAGQGCQASQHDAWSRQRSAATERAQGGG